MRKFIETLTWITLDWTWKLNMNDVNKIWTWTLWIISLTLFSDNLTRDAMHSCLFEMLMCIVVVLDPIVGF